MRLNRLLTALSAVALLVAWPSFALASDPGPAIDVSLVTPDDFAAIVIHPQRIAQSPLVAESLKDPTIAGAIKKFGIDPSEVEQIVVLIGLGKDRSKRLEPIAVTILGFTHEVDAKEVLTKLQAAMTPRGAEPVREVNVAGKTCLEIGPARDALLAYAPSKGTIVLTTKENMKTVLAVAEPKGPLLERLKKADAGHDIIVALAPDAFPNFDTIMEAAKASAPPLVGTYLDAAKTVRGATATGSLTGPRLLRVVLDAKDAEAAGNIEELLQQALRMASGGLALAKQGIPKEMRATLDPLVKLAAEFIDGGNATKSGSEVTLDFKRPQVLDTAGTTIIGAARQSIMNARAAARQARQMNNMKQIALAMIMYEEIHNYFPPAAIERNGKPLLSWRVAILPFLEEDALYKQFHLDESWDSPHNREVAKKMPSVFQSPDSPSNGKTRVMLFTGKGAAFDGGRTIKPTDIRNGTGATDSVRGSRTRQGRAVDQAGGFAF